MRNIFKEMDEASNLWIQKRAFKKGLAGKGPWIIYRCQKCRGAFIEKDIIGAGKTGLCPVCNTNRFECAFLSFFENIRFVIRILRGK